MASRIDCSPYSIQFMILASPPFGEPGSCLNVDLWKELYILFTSTTHGLIMKNYIPSIPSLIMFIGMILVPATGVAAIYGKVDSPLLDSLPAEPSTPLTAEEREDEKVALSPKPILHAAIVQNLDQALKLMRDNNIDLSDLEIDGFIPGGRDATRGEGPYVGDPSAPTADQVICNVWNRGFRTLHKVRFRFVDGKLDREEYPNTRKVIASWQTPTKPTVSLRRALLGHRAAVAIVNATSQPERHDQGRNSENICDEKLSAELVWRDGVLLWEIANQGMNRFKYKTPPYSLIDAHTGRVLRVYTGQGGRTRIQDGANYNGFVQTYPLMEPLPPEAPGEPTPAEISIAQTAMAPALQHRVTDKPLQRVQALLTGNSLSMDNLEIFRFVEVHPDLEHPDTGIELVHGRLWHKGYPTLKHVHYAFVDGKLESTSNPLLRSEVASWNVPTKPAISCRRAIAGYRQICRELQNISQQQEESWPEGNNSTEGLLVNLIADHSSLVWHIKCTKKNHPRNTPEITAMIDAATGEIFYLSIPRRYDQTVYASLRYQPDDTEEDPPLTGVPPEPSTPPLAQEREHMKAIEPQEIIHKVTGDDLKTILALFADNNISIEGKRICSAGYNQRAEKHNERKIWHVFGEIWRNGYPTGENFDVHFLNGKVFSQNDPSSVMKSDVEPAPTTHVTARQAFRAYMILEANDVMRQQDIIKTNGQLDPGWWKERVAIFQVNDSRAYWILGHNQHHLGGTSENVKIDAVSGRIISYFNGIIND